MNKNLVIITAVWCSSCLIVLNNLKQVIMEFPNLNVINFDYDLDEDKFSKYNIGTTLPVMILMDNNKNEIKRLVGEKTSNEIKSFLINN